MRAGNNRLLSSRVRAWAIMFFLLCGMSVSASALTIDDLIAQNKLTVIASIAADAPVAVGQPIVVTIEIATDRWFSKGSRVETFAIERVVIPPVSELAINGNKKVNGKTWITQAREIVLYPLSEGEFRVPEISVFISVNTEQGVVDGLVKTSDLSFSAFLPSALKGLDTYVVSPQVSLTVDGGFSGDREYRVGDAVTQVITLKAEATPAMMLPEFQRISLSGISSYRKPAEVTDKSVRGLLIGQRRETVVYMFEAAGDYQLPEQIIFWWNSQDKELVELVVPAQAWQVESALFSWRSLFDYDQPGHSLSLLLLLCLVILLVRLGGLSRVRVTVKKLASPKLRMVRHVALYFYAVKIRDYAQACQYLYLIHGLPRDGVDQLRGKFKTEGCLVALDKLYQLSFCKAAKSKNPVADLSTREAYLLIGRESYKPVVKSGVITDDFLELN